jgi:uncharacterized protein YndB with AHSA1/START domain
MNQAVDGRARALADLAEGSILAVVEIAAAPERVFRALSSAEIASWWGSPDTYRTTRWNGDVRPGGKWLAEGVGADGQQFSVGGEFLQVEPPRLLKHTWVAPWDGNHSTVVTYLLEAANDGTRVTLRHTGFGGRAASCNAHSDGWVRVLGWLAAYAAPAPALRYFVLRLIPPRPDFARTMNAQEAGVMKEHAIYLRGKIREGQVVVAGPVADPAGDWGVVVARAMSASQVEALRDGDPAIKSALGLRYEILPMMSAMIA